MEVSTIKFFGKSFLLGIIAELRKYKVSDFLGSFCLEFIYPSLIRTRNEIWNEIFQDINLYNHRKMLHCNYHNSGK